MGEVWPEAGAAPGAFREPVSSHNSVQIWARSRAGEQTCSTRDDEASGELFTERSGVPRVMCSLGMSCGGHFVHPSPPSQARQQWGPGKLKPGMGPSTGHRMGGDGAPTAAGGEKTMGKRLAVVEWERYSLLAVVCARSRGRCVWWCVGELE